MKKTSALTLLYAGFVYAFFTSVAFATLALSSPARAQQDTTVDVVEVKRQFVSHRLVVPASVTANNISDLSFGVAGRLRDFNVDVGDTINQGKVIARLDQRQVEATIASLQAQQQAAAATLDDEQQQLNELQALAKTDFVAQGELRRARAAVAVAQAQLAEIEAALNARQVDLDYHQLQAPFDAVVVERSVNIGEWVTEQTAAFRLVEQNSLLAEAYLAQRYFRQLNDASRIRIQYDDGARDVAASIKSKVAFVDPDTRTFLLRLEPENTSELTAGAAVEAVITLRSDQQQLTVPQDAVIRYSDGRTSVWVAEPANEGYVAREKLVTLGSAFNGWVAIGDSLTADTKVVVRGNESLTDGESLSIQQSQDYEAQQ